MKYSLSMFDVTSFKSQECNHNHLKPVCEAFSSSLSNINVLLWLPAIITHYAMARDRCLISSCFEILKKLGTAEDEAPEKVRLVLKRRDEKWELFKSSMASNADDTIEDLKKSMKIVEEIPQEFPDTHAQFQQQMMNGIVLLWSAVEVFIADLWIAAVNKSPTLEARCLERSKGLTIDFKTIKELGYDLRGRAGDVLASKLGLETLAACKNAYILAFEGAGLLFNSPGPPRPADSKSVDDVDFPSLYKEMILLREARNAIAHKNGRISRRYKDAIIEAEGAPSFQWWNLEEGDKIEVTGASVSDFAKSAMVFCTKLLNFVDLNSGAAEG